MYDNISLPLVPDGGILKWHVPLAGKCTEQTHQVRCCFQLWHLLHSTLKCVLRSFTALPFAWLLLWVLPLPHVNTKRILRVYSFYIRVFFCIIWRKSSIRKMGLQLWQINPPHVKNWTLKSLYSLFLICGLLHCQLIGLFPMKPSFFILIKVDGSNMSYSTFLLIWCHTIRHHS